MQTCILSTNKMLTPNSFQPSYCSFIFRKSLNASLLWDIYAHMLAAKCLPPCPYTPIDWKVHCLKHRRVNHFCAHQAACIPTRSLLHWSRGQRHQQPRFTWTTFCSSCILLSTWPSTNQSPWCMVPLPKKTKPEDAAIERVSILLKDLLLAKEEQEVVEKDSGGEVRSHIYLLSIGIGNWLPWIMQLGVLANLNQFLEGQRRYQKHLTL